MTTHPPISLPSDLRLRNVTEADLPILFAQQWDPEASQMAAFPPRDWDAFLVHWTKILADPRVAARTILLHGQVAGSIVSWEQNGTQLVGYWIGKSYWGKGVATRALTEFLGVVRARPLYAHVAKHNIGSIRVLEKCGFTLCDEEAQSRDAPSDGVEEFVFQLCGTESEDGGDIDRSTTTAASIVPEQRGRRS